MHLVYMTIGAAWRDQAIQDTDLGVLFNINL
jgi:hypothetical protein